MKITKTNEQSSRPGWLDHTFQLELTGEEIVRLYNLAYEAEGGPQHPSPLEDRSFVWALESHFGEGELVRLQQHLSDGKVIL